MKRYIVIFMAIILGVSCLVSGCEIKITDDAGADGAFAYECKENIVYTVDQLTEIDNCEIMEKRQFFEKYPTPYVTEYDNGESRFLYYTEENVLAVYFDRKEKRDMVYNDTFKLSVPKEQFDQIKPGDAIEEVEEMDPNGFYPFSETHSTGTHHSAHYTSDKHIVWIYYSADYYVERIESEAVDQ